MKKIKKQKRHVAFDALNFADLLPGDLYGNYHDEWVNECEGNYVWCICVSKEIPKKSPAKMYSWTIKLKKECPFDIRNEIIEFPLTKHSSESNLGSRICGFFLRNNVLMFPASAKGNKNVAKIAKAYGADLV